MKYLFLLILIIPLKAITIKRKNEETNCNSYKNCFTCSTCNEITLPECECMWIGNSCELTPTKLKYTKEWWNKFNLCIDNNSTESQNKYCGYPIKKNEKSKNTIITYPEIDSHYGKEYLYCKYEYKINTKENDYVLLKIQMNKDIKDNIPLIGITFIYENEFLYHLIYDIGTYNFEKLKLSNADIAYIHLFSFDEYSSNPISIEFDLDKKKKKIKNVFFIIMIVILILIIITSIIFVWLHLNKKHKLKKKKIQDNILQFRLQYLTNNTRLFSENESINEKICCICEEEFRNQTQICKIPCRHICHYYCLENKIIQKNDNIKCKYCNSNILQSIDNNSEINNSEENLNNNNYIQSLKERKMEKGYNINSINENQNNNIENNVVPSIFNSEQRENNYSNNNIIPRNSKDPFNSNVVNI